MIGLGSEKMSLCIWGVFLAVRPDFSYHNEKLVAANQSYFFQELFNVKKLSSCLSIFLIFVLKGTLKRLSPPLTENQKGLAELGGTRPPTPRLQSPFSKNVIFFRQNIMHSIFDQLHFHHMFGDEMTLSSDKTGKGASGPPLGS